MKRSFAEYVLYFIDDRTSKGSLSRLAKTDPAFPEKERDDKRVYSYLMNSERYSSYQLVVITLYHKYQCF